MLDNLPLEENAPMPSALLRPGRNCWTIERAARAAMLTNSHYFHALARSLEAAEHSIFLMGWDLDANLVLDGDGPRHLPLVDFLVRLLERQPDLRIRLLLWDRTIFYGGNRLSSKALAAAQKAQPRLEYHYHSADLGASHHAKLICIDDRIAYAGGIDLAGDRWDPDDHPASHPRRVTPEGDVYGPVHDLQMLIEGPAASALAAMLRSRWRRVTGQIIAPLGAESRAAWPDEVTPDFENVPLAIARTDAADGIREVENLNADILDAARDCIYIETQYLTSRLVGDILARRLEEPDGPEIIVIVTRTSGGLVEQFAMGGNRDRLLRRLHRADRHGRLRVFYPTTGQRDTAIDVKIHAKLVIVDERFLRVGSSNLNNRSMGVDTECDVALEAADPTMRAGIGLIRARLIGEQLRRPIPQVLATIGREGSVIRAIDAMNDGGYLRRLRVSPTDGPREPMLGTALLDPVEPVRLWSRCLAFFRGQQLFRRQPEQTEGQRQQKIEDAKRNQRADHVCAGE